MKSLIHALLITAVFACSSMATEELKTTDNEIMVWDGMPLKHSCDKNQMTVNACAKEVWETADDELNRVYQTQMVYLKEMEIKWKTTGMSEKRLIEAQRAWLLFRDRDCAYQVGDGGSSAPFESFKCMYKRTITRIKELQEYVDCRVNGCPF